MARCRLMVRLLAGRGALERLSAALAATELAAAIITGPTPTIGHPVAGAAGAVRATLSPEEALSLVRLAQGRGVATLIANDIAAAKALAADGIHFDSASNSREGGKGAAGTGEGDTGAADIGEAVRRARAALGAQANIGFHAGTSRHAAMIGGEAGADYVAFGLDEAGSQVHREQREALKARRLELVGWWASLMEVPVVALDVETAEEAKALAEAGADFLCLTLCADQAPTEIAEQVRTLHAALKDRTPA